MAKPLNLVQMQALEMLSRGASENEVAKLCGKSRSWVQCLKRRDDYQQLLKNCINKVQEIVVEKTAEAIGNDISDDLEQFRSQLRVASHTLFSASLLYLEKIKQRIEILNVDEIPASRLAQVLKHASESLINSLEIHQQLLGIDELIKDLNDIKKIGSERFETTNGHESFSDRIETN